MFGVFVHSMFDIPATFLRISYMKKGYSVLKSYTVAPKNMNALENTKPSGTCQQMLLDIFSELTLFLKKNMSKYLFSSFKQ